jgi:hypothetical protein
MSQKASYVLWYIVPVLVLVDGRNKYSSTPLESGTSTYVKSTSFSGVLESTSPSNSICTRTSYKYFEYSTRIESTDSYEVLLFFKGKLYVPYFRYL